MELLMLLVVLALAVPVALFAAPLFLYVGPFVIAGFGIGYLMDRRRASRRALRTRRSERAVTSRQGGRRRPVKRRPARQAG